MGQRGAAESGLACDSPWHLILYVDERATDRQRVALENIFLGRAGGTAAKNYASAIGEVYAVKPARIELDHTPGREHLRIGSLVEAATASSFATGERISWHPRPRSARTGAGCASHASKRCSASLALEQFRQPDSSYQIGATFRCLFTRS